MGSYASKRTVKPKLAISLPPLKDQIEDHAWFENVDAGAAQTYACSMTDSRFITEN